MNKDVGRSENLEGGGGVSSNVVGHGGLELETSMARRSNLHLIFLKSGGAILSHSPPVPTALLCELSAQGGRQDVIFTTSRIVVKHVATSSADGTVG